MAVRKRVDNSSLRRADISAKGSIDQTGDESPDIGKEKIEGGERVDQIRDILFGAQRQEYETRFSRLEELLVKNISDLSNETTSKFTRYQEEYGKRLTRLEELLLKNVSELSFETERKINTHKGENDKRFRELEEQSKKAISELREETEKQFNQQKSEYSQELSSLEVKLINSMSDLKKQFDSDGALLKKSIDSAKSEILHSLENLNLNKVDRSTLAGFLHHIATNLENKDHKTDSGKK